MSTLSDAPSLSKGAIEVIEGSRLIYTIYFQYNPGKVSRSLKPRWQKDEKSILPMRAEGVPDTEAGKLVDKGEESDGFDVGNVTIRDDKGHESWFFF